MMTFSVRRSYSSTLSRFFAFLISLLIAGGVAATPAQAALSCDQQQSLNTQFRLSNNSTGSWLSGADLTNQRLTVGATIDINCFAQNGSSQLENGAIDVTNPQGQTVRISDTPQLNGYPIYSTGQFTFVCRSKTISSCSDSDTFFVPTASQAQAVPTPTPTPTPSPTPRVTPSPSPSPSPVVEQRSTCDSLRVVSGNDSLVPARVTLRAAASDNLGNIQKYRFYFGTGDQVESTSPEVTYEYKASGTFSARTDAQDSRGNWKTSSACEAIVTVKPATIESHKAACADLFVTANNQAKAPSTVKFEITGYDNKGGVKRYKIDFGNGITKEGEGATFEQVYSQAGTYPVKAYIQDSEGNWLGGSNNCRRDVTITSTTLLLHQPSTGTPTIIPLLGAGSGIAGAVIEFVRRRRAA